MARLALKRTHSRSALEPADSSTGSNVCGLCCLAPGKNVHWADGALLDVMRGILRRARRVPLLILAQVRPLLEPRLQRGGGLTASKSLQLELLDAGKRGLLDELGRADGLAAPVLADLATQSGDNPFFAEQLLADVLVAGIAAGDAVIGVAAHLALLLGNLRRFRRR